VSTSPTWPQDQHGRATGASPGPIDKFPPQTDAVRPATALDAFAALALVAGLHQIAADPAALLHQQNLSAGDAITSDAIILAAKSLQLRAKSVRLDIDRIALTPLPALAWMNDGGLAVVAQCDGSKVLIQQFGGGSANPAHKGSERRPLLLSVADFARRCTGELLLVSSRATLAAELSRFDFTWFVPSLVKYRRLLAEVVAVSLCLQVFALVSPLFFQVVMDKVLAHEGYSTLNVIVLGLVVVTVFESLLTVLRAYVLSHTTSRIDVELGSKLYRHLLSLPLAYFEARRTGDSVARVRELENIRAFLTGNALTLVLDVLFSLVFIAVMLLYSVKLTLVVLASLPIYVLISLTVVPPLRARLEEQFARGAENQSLLVESVSGAQTVKANALEPTFAHRWDQQLAAYVSASFKAGNLGAFANESVSLVGKLVAAAVLWLGAHAVMDGELTVGMFIAFTMFANRVAQPILRIAQMWTDFQRIGLSVRRLGDILNTRTEVPPQAAVQVPSLQGHVRFDDVTFRYRSEAAPVIRGLSLEIQPGEVIGIVGRSGSGKSTLTKLIQRLYTPEVGRILVDGVDISLIDAAQLRRQLGVVLQDNLLFNRSVRENIAIIHPAAPIEAVMQVARLAGAHDFISELPEGYDTVLGEQGCGLSGGQRQRIAIARAVSSRRNPATRSRHIPATCCGAEERLEAPC
jgi:subfamily B ATP-binding cassette protein HlyB/CyaB